MFESSSNSLSSGFVISNQYPQGQRAQEKVGGGSGGCFGLFGGNNNNNTNNNLPSPTTSSLLINDADLAKEMNELSVNERERVLDDIHGVAGIPVESDDFVQECMDRFDKALTELPQKMRRKALERAFFLDPNLSKDVPFKLMFLRADYYDPYKAARRFAKYFEDKLALFGEAKLVKKITLDDLNEEDMKVFEGGFFVILPHKDTAGRPIWFGDVSKYDFTRATEMTKVAWYQTMATLEDEAAQLKGISNVTKCMEGFKLGVSLSKFFEVMFKAGDMLSNLPIRTTSYHFCYNNPGVEFVLSALRRASGKHSRLRLRAHVGSDVEVQYELMAFGIQCPFLVGGGGGSDGNNDGKAKLHRDYTERRREKDRQEMQAIDDHAKVTGFVPYPNPNDILVGRGRPYQTFPGNVMLSDLIDREYLERYMNTTTNRFDKTCMHLEAIKTIQTNYGGRFIERISNGWRVVDEVAARKKVGSAFRSKMAKTTTNTNITTTTGASSHFYSNPFRSVEYPASPPHSGGEESVAGGSINPLENPTIPNAKRIRYSPSHEGM